MKTIKIKKITVLAVLLVLIMGTISFAAEKEYSYRTNVEILSEMTGKTVEDLREECAESGKNIWAVAEEEGILEEFKEEILETKKQAIENKVKTGSITEEQGNRIIENFKLKQNNCTGLGGNGFGMGMRNGNGNGQKLQDGSCLNNDYRRNNINRNPKVENNNTETNEALQNNGNNNKAITTINENSQNNGNNNNSYGRHNGYHQGNGGGNGIHKRDGTGIGCRR